MMHFMRKTCRHQTGLTLVELMVALAIGSFLKIGALQIYNQRRHSFGFNESVARVQEKAAFAMDTIEVDLRMASNWGRNSRSLAVEGRSILGDPNPNGLPAPTDCGADWALNLALPIDGDNNIYALPCAPTGDAQLNSDVVTVRRASVAPVPLKVGRLQIQTTRVPGQLFSNGLIPSSFSATDSATHNLIVNSYYVSQTSDLIPNTPTLRRKTLTMVAGVPVIQDLEIAPGVENIQLQFGIDVNNDNAVDRYVNPGDPIYNPAAAGYIPGARVRTARVWLLVRVITLEQGRQASHKYAMGDVVLGIQNDNYRRMQVSKTILLRNART